MTSLTDQQQPIRVVDLISTFRQLRERRDEIKERHATELKPISEAMDALGAVLLDTLNKAGLESLRTEEGTAFRSTKTSYKIDDPTVLREYVEAKGLTDLYENRLSAKAIEELISRGEPLPPGIGVSHFVTVQVRKS